LKSNFNWIWPVVPIRAFIQQLKSSRKQFTSKHFNININLNGWCGPQYYLRKAFIYRHRSMLNLSSNSYSTHFFISYSTHFIFSLKNHFIFEKTHQSFLLNYKRAPWLWALSRIWHWYFEKASLPPYVRPPCCVCEPCLVFLKSSHLIPSNF
jgi:hypothetical protein